MQKFVVDIAGLVCEFISDETAVLGQCQRLFGDRFIPEISESIDLRVELMVRDKLPALPQEPPIATEQFLEGGLMYVYHRGTDRVALYLTRSHGLVMDVTGLNKQAPPSVRIWMRKSALVDGGLEDVTMFALSPFLRRNNSFLMHAFSAAIKNEAVLFVGTSGSGKTTTGLSVLANGWHFLANDVSVLRLQPEGVLAFPAPGCFNIHPNTLQLLPNLAINPAAFNEVYGKYEVPVDELVSFSGGEGKRPFPVRAICLLQQQSSFAHEIQLLSPAIALAQIMEESIDRWDTQTFAAHVELLEQVVEQSACYQLKLGRDVTGLPLFLEENFAQES
jgi:hypothetical protein